MNVNYDCQTPISSKLHQKGGCSNPESIPDLAAKMKQKMMMMSMAVLSIEV
jgi:hypothetical protein